MQIITILHRTMLIRCYKMLYIYSWKYTELAIYLFLFIFYIFIFSQILYFIYFSLFLLCMPLLGLHFPHCGIITIYSILFYSTNKYEYD